jgi:hypothetical protein
VTDVKLDDAAIQAMLDDETGLVGSFLQDLASRAATVARLKVQVRTSPSWSILSDARPPGFTRAMIHTRMGHSSTGRLWASANAPYDPAIFLEKPREDRRQYPFLTAGLWSLEGTL